jgi:hypothetical protein
MGDWEPTVDADEPTLSPGEDTTIYVETRHIHGLQLLLPIHTENNDLEFGDMSPSPPPDRQADVSPPEWYWTDCTDVEVEVPVRVHQDASPATIDYTVHLIQSLDGSGGTQDRQYTITITNG